MKILRTEVKDYGGVQAFTDVDDAPVYMAPYLLKTHWDGKRLTPAGVTYVSDAIAARQAAAEESANEQRWREHADKARAAIAEKMRASGDTSAWTARQIEDAVKAALATDFGIETTARAL